MIHPAPRYQLGYLLPVAIADTVYYQFHRVFPSEVLMLGYPLGLGGFNAGGVEPALERFMEGVDFVTARGVDRIVQGGIPVAALIGRARTLRLIEDGAKRSGLPVSADFEDTIAAFETLGARRVAVASKWDEALMDAVARYLADAGIQVDGLHAEAHTMQEVKQVRPTDGVEMALRLGRAALQAAPDADALLLAGGAWLSSLAVATLEAEFGKPVVTNLNATWWATLRQLGLRSEHPGWGRLIDGLHQEQRETAAQSA